MRALVRAVSPTMADCELTHLDRQPIDPVLAAVQHDGYCAALTSLGARVIQVPPAPALPDAVFVEDTAVVFPELAVICRPGAPSRQAETSAVARVLSGMRNVERIQEGATLDGGDVMTAGKNVFVGVGGRSSMEAVAQLSTWLSPFGYRVTAESDFQCLHLKSAVTALDPETLLLSPALVDPSRFDGYRLIEVDPDETNAANALALGGAVIIPDAYPKTAQKLRSNGYRVIALPCSEIIKAEGAVTCCSVLVD